MTPLQPPPGGPYGSVPTLTEVVDVAAPSANPTATPASPPGQAPGTASPSSAAPANASLAAPAPAASAQPRLPIDEAAIADRVMREVQSQLDRMLEVRLREALAPVLVRTADAMVRDARREIVAVLREAVDRAVQEARGGR
jgi:hypothetical protein